MPALLSVLVKHGLELSAIAFVTLFLFYAAPRRPSPCDCALCRRQAETETHFSISETVSESASDAPSKTATLGDTGLDSVEGISEVSSVDGRAGTISPSTSGSTESLATPPRALYRPRFPPIEVSLPRLASPRIKTSPVISKEEFNLIMETSPRGHAKKFGHALAVRMVAERRRSMQASN